MGNNESTPTEEPTQQQAVNWTPARFEAYCLDGPILVTVVGKDGKFVFRLEQTPLGVIAQSYRAHSKQSEEVLRKVRDYNTVAVQELLPLITSQYTVTDVVYEQDLVQNFVNRE